MAEGHQCLAILCNGAKRTMKKKKKHEGAHKMVESLFFPLPGEHTNHFRITSGKITHSLRLSE